MLAALTQAIIVKLHRLYTRNLGFRLYRRALIEENKWRAARWGLDGKLIDFGKRAEVPMRELALELLEFVDDVVDELESREAVEYVHTVLREGTSADRQLAVYRETGDLRRSSGTSSRRRAPGRIAMEQRSDEPTSDGTANWFAGAAVNSAFLRRSSTG